jgi:predicted nuclease of predicted toxin-antitoxin system
LIVWIDAQLSPYLARWLSSEFDVGAKPVRELGLRDARDHEIFLAARMGGAVVMTKDSDFVLLLEQLEPPPQVLWLTVVTLRTRTTKRYCQEASPQRKGCFSMVSPWSKFRRRGARFRSAVRELRLWSNVRIKVL